MREFKLKKWYPSLPVQWKDEETIVVVQNDPFGYRLHPSIKGVVNTKVVTFEEVESSDYWQEMKPDLRNYEIIGLSTDRDIFTKEPTNLWYRKNADTNEGHYTNLAEGQLYGNLPLKIYSVRRLSDGEIFTIGDRAHLTNGNYYDSTIGGFKITHNDYGLEKYRDRKTLKVGLKSNMYPEREFPFFELDKIKKRNFLFNSEDDIDIFEGDTVYQVSTVDKRYDIHSTTAREEITPPPSYFKYFRHKKNADDFIIREKPVLTASEIHEILKPYIIDFKHIEAYGKLYDAIKKKLK